MGSIRPRDNSSSLSFTSRVVGDMGGRVEERDLGMEGGRLDPAGSSRKAYRIIQIEHIHVRTILNDCEFP